MLAQGTPRVGTPEEPAPLQLWHQTESQFLESVRQRSGQQVETIGGVRLEPLFEQIGELLGRTDEAPGVGLGRHAWWDGGVPRCGPGTRAGFGLGEDRQDALEDAQYAPGRHRLRLMLYVSAPGIFERIVV